MVKPITLDGSEDLTNRTAHTLFIGPNDSRENAFRAIKALNKKIKKEYPHSELIVEAEENFIEKHLRSTVVNIGCSLLKGPLTSGYDLLRLNLDRVLYEAIPNEPLAMSSEKRELLEKAIIGHRTFRVTNDPNNPFGLIKDTDYLHLAEKYGVKDQILGGPYWPK